MVTLEVDECRIPIVPQGSGVAIEEVLGSLELQPHVATKLATLLSEGVEFRLGATLERRGRSVRCLSLTINPVADSLGRRVPNWPTVVDGGLSVVNPRGVESGALAGQ